LDLEVTVTVVVQSTPETRLSIDTVFFAVLLATLLEDTVLPSLSFVVFTSMVTPVVGSVEEIFTAID
jgi:hypothetical protein